MAKKKTKSDFSFADFLKDLEKSKITNAVEVDTLPQKKYYLIVCEGEKTEPNYFGMYQKLLPKNVLDMSIIGEGAETIRVVERALIEKEKRVNDPINPPYDEVWAVFDKDDFPDQRFNEAVDLAQRNDVKAGYSNQAFELWYVLHFQRMDSQITRHAYFEILSGRLGSEYTKNDQFIPVKIRHEGDVRLAIRYAKDLKNLFKDTTPSGSWPSTHFFKLIETFEDLIEKLQR